MTQARRLEKMPRIELVRDEPRGSRRRTSALAPRDSVHTSRRAAVDPVLEVRRSTLADLPWIETWATQLGLPAQRGRGITSLIFLKDGQRVGYISAKHDEMMTAMGRQPVQWIMSAFLIPSVRGQGLLLRFGALASRKFYRNGKLGARIATGNRRMLKLMQVGGWRKVRSSRQYQDFVLDLKSPYGGMEA